jgi:hypothetical protein
MKQINRRAPIEGLSDELLNARQKQRTFKEKQLELAKRKKAEELALKEFNAKLKANRTKLVKVREFFRKFHKYKKTEYSKELWLSIKHCSMLFPQGQIAEAKRRLRGSENSFEQKVLNRLVILPKKDYLEFEKMIGQTFSQGIFYMRLAFVSEDALKKKGVIPTLAHEVSHLIDHFSGNYRNTRSSEALGEARALFAFSMVSQKAKTKSLNQALTEFKAAQRPKDYIQGINLGRAIFILADSIRREAGVREAEGFIREVAKYEEINDELVRGVYEELMKA